MNPQRATARAHANIALVKYWGKRDSALNLPAAGSLSLTLNELSTETTVEFGTAEEDSLELGGEAVVGSALGRMSRWLDLVRERASIATKARVVSSSNFPTASGLASSASAFAALSLAASSAAGLELSPRELSILARRGSGSAARSIFPGLVVMHPGREADGSDAFAEPIATSWTDELAMVIAVVGSGVAKKHSSRDAMNHCAQTSPLYAGWLSTVASDITAAQSAIEGQDFAALGRVAEASALTMHASMWAARPAIMYWQPTTLHLIHAVQELRENGAAAYVSIDAGPHVKVLTRSDEAAAIAGKLETIDGVGSVIVSKPGPGARLIHD